jgi:hypothetical protein
MTIREKAERLVRLPGYGESESGEEWPDYRFIEQAHEVAQYVLDSIHADDGEPVTEEWFESIGATWQYDPNHHKAVIEELVLQSHVLQRRLAALEASKGDEG